MVLHRSTYCWQSQNGALEAEDPRLAPWVAEARALAEGFRLRELVAVLAPHNQTPVGQVGCG